ncbi:uncharacterized protein LOC132544679 [Ylistrum balloti]|uniref:uncharacterized protein LOC132544679 n=1 Tax=Ylistrum balloti TaxID=509963 RepID=UPI0029059F2D|nr:uncharacterized protein LOC132544679 [Ylistrum balloti]
MVAPVMIILTQAVLYALVHRTLLELPVQIRYRARRQPVKMVAPVMIILTQAVLYALVHRTLLELPVQILSRVHHQFVKMAVRVLILRQLAVLCAVVHRFLQELLAQMRIMKMSKTRWLTNEKVMSGLDGALSREFSKGIQLKEGECVVTLQEERHKYALLGSGVSIRDLHCRVLDVEKSVTNVTIDK